MNLAHRLDVALKRRAALVADQQRVQGKLEQAQTNLSAVEAEIRERKIEPSNLATVRQKLEEQLESSLQQIEADLDSAEKALTPFLQETP